MGYNKSYGPIRRMQKYLDALLSSRRTMDFAAQEPAKLAYRLREAIAASEEWDRYEKYTVLKDWYRFECEEGHVRARYQLRVEPIEMKSKASETREVSTMPEVTVTEATTVTAVVGAGLKFNSHDEIRFPNAVLTPEEKLTLWKWCQTSGWEIIDHEEAGLTLTRKDVSEAILFRPGGSE